MIHALPSIVEASKSSVTVSKYKFYFEKFRKCCTMCSLQSSPATVIIYIGGLIQQGVSVAVLESHFYAIKWYHDFNFTSNPCSDKFLSLVVEGGRRILGKSVNKKEPLTPEMLRLIVSKYGDENDLSKFRVCVICLLWFSGYLRYSELSNIKMKNRIFHDSHGELTLDKSKTDIYRRVKEVCTAGRFNF